jgi:hypothetical protein
MLGKMKTVLLDESTKLKPITVSQDDQVKAYIKKIMSQLNKWMLKSKISKLIIVITSKETGEPVERWQFDVCNTLASLFIIVTDHDRSKYSAKTLRKRAPPKTSMKMLQGKRNSSSTSQMSLITVSSATEQASEKSDQDVQQEIQSIFRQITASVTFLPMMATAPSTYWSTPIKTQRCLWNGVTVMQKTSKMPKRCNYAASPPTTTRSIHL